MVAACVTPGLDGFSTTMIEVGDATLTVAVADTDDERRQGLRGVEELPRGIDGMLFVFEEPRPATFGMRDALIPLDIWWFDEDGSLLGSTTMTPCPTEPCAVYASPAPIAWALETPRGEHSFPPGTVLSSGDSG